MFIYIWHGNDIYDNLYAIYAKIGFQALLDMSVECK